MLVATDRPSAVAARAATATTPIVFTSGFDPVQIGLVASFNRPDGNATGVSLLTTELGPNRLGLVRELSPNPGTIAFVINPNSASTRIHIPEKRRRPRRLSANRCLFLSALAPEEEVDRAFAAMAERNVAALLYGATLFFQVISERLVALAARYQIVVPYEWREFRPDRRGPDQLTARIATKLDEKQERMLGAYSRARSRADLPVVHSSRFEFVINLKWRLRQEPGVDGRVRSGRYRRAR